MGRLSLLAIKAGNGGTLSCTPNPVTVLTNGVASFAGCKITGGSAGTYTFRATSGSLTSATSNNVTIT